MSSATPAGRDRRCADLAQRPRQEGGTCLREDLGPWDLGTADQVDCGEAHALQFVAVVPLSGPVDPLADPDDLTLRALLDEALRPPDTSTR